MTGFLLSLHILVFGLSLAFTAGVGILCARVARTGSPEAIRATFTAAQPLQIAGGIGWLVTAILGVAVASAFAIPLTATWLLWSYAAFVVLFLSGVGLHSPWMAKVIAAAAASDGQKSEDLQALLRSPVSPLASALSAASVIALIYLMSAKPG